MTWPGRTRERLKPAGLRGPALLAVAALCLFSASPAAAQDDTDTAAARRAFAKARLGPGGEDGAAGLNARWALARALEDDSRFAEAEREYRALETRLAPQSTPDDRNLMTVRQRIANVQVGQEHFEAALETARPVYAQALSTYGPDHAVTQDLRLALAASLARLERYAESEPYARAGFDYMRAHGDDQGAADIAATLALIYRKLERPDEARAVLLLVEGEDPVRRLFNAAERAADPAQEALAWRRVLEMLPPDSAQRTDVELKLAFALSMAGSDADPGPSREAAEMARGLIVRGRAANLPDVVSQAEQILANALTHLTAEDGTASSTTLAVAQSRLAEALATGDPDRKAVIDARVYLAMAATAMERFDLASPELDRIDAWIAAHPGGVNAQTVAYAAMTRAVILGRQEDLAGAYHALDRTSRATRAVALARTDGSGRSHLRHWSELFRTQVRWAWRYADRLEGAGQGAAPD
jgi:tetratricopeptide (TPR) repeat protein